MKLDRPIVFIDLETTGTDVGKDRIVEIGAVKLFPNGEREIKIRRLNPEMIISPEATAVHGISNEDVFGCPTFKVIASSLLEYISGCDIGGYNLIKFDFPILVEEFCRSGLDYPEEDTKLIDPFKIFTIKEPRDLAAAFKKYCGKELEGAHSAEADILATVEIFEAQIKHYEDLPSTVAEMDEYCREGKVFVDYAGNLLLNEDDEVVFAFGKHKGKRVRDNAKYVEWMLKSEFPSNTKQELIKIMSNG